jgi:pseudouridine-5'-phosphate glycosidase
VPAALPSNFRVLPHIRRAIDAGAPIVALESSVLAQGLPVPQNAAAAARMVAAVEASGSVAAITAVVCGSPSIGMDGRDLERFLRRDGIRKVSSRDLASAIVDRADGATTVAAAIALAALAGVRTFAAGGIGGVHRRSPIGKIPSPLDESADLTELARTPMIVVCAGAKSILDLPATWERLDTLGIPVVGLGTDEFPGFYVARTGIPLATSVDSAAGAARLAAAHFALGRSQSMVVVQPPPANVALDAELVEGAVARALERGSREGVRGAAVTPYLLAAVSKETDGQSLNTNLALLEANARLAGEIAVALASAV